MEMKDIIVDIIKSWAHQGEVINSDNELVEWINELNSKVKVKISKKPLSQVKSWRYDPEKGHIANTNNSFFQIKGLRKKTEKLIVNQPIIIQQEIGYLGIICKKIDGVLYFLMQGKIEPGNINKVQISPTIQATKSNFTQKHGGAKPPYLEYFVDKNRHQVIVDQIQSEQSSRFYKKRNRNIIIIVEEEIEVLPNYRWMTLKQIKKLMKIDNLVNMDTRTVISCIPYCSYEYSHEVLCQVEDLFNNKSLFKSIFIKEDTNHIKNIYNYINDYKMYNEEQIELVDIRDLDGWEMQDDEIVCKNKSNFKVVFCDISIEGREVQNWEQPLFEAIGMATFGLIITKDKGRLKFLVRGISEVGCFDKIELGPTVQLEPCDVHKDSIADMFLKKWKNKEGIRYDVILSEEGGRFFHEQNYNVIIEVEKEELGELPEGYFLVDFYTLNTLIQINNCLNIQLRNLLSLLEV